MANAASFENLSDEPSDDLDAEMDSDQEQDLDKMLGTWLGELENMTKQLGGNGPEIAAPIPATPPPPTPTLDNLDNFRFSMANLEETQDVDLDALLGDLCQMEKELEWQADQTNKNSQVEELPDVVQQGEDEVDGGQPITAQNGNIGIPVFPSYQTSNIDIQDSSNSNANVTVVSPAQNTSVSIVPENQPSTPTPTDLPTPASVPTPTSLKDRWPSPPPPVLTSPVITTPTARSPPPQPTVTTPTITTSPKLALSPDGISPSNTLEKMSNSVRIRLESLHDNLSKEELTEEEKVARVKAEKIRIALEKLKEARVRKLIIRVYTEDGSSKTVLVDENMTCRDVCHLLVEKNHFEESPNWVLVERLSELYMERTPEEHEHLVTDILLLWPRETNNTILFMEKREKYALFKNPQHYLLSSKSSNTAQEFAEKSKQDLVDEFFLSGANSVPELEGFLFLKAEGKKSWKKHFCMLRGSGIYYCPKGKSKSLKDLSCYVQFEHVNVYNGVGWKKKYKAPTDFCFALKHPQIMQKSKYIKYMCADDYRTAQRWITGIRLAKNGKLLYDNYEVTLKEMSDYTSTLGSLRSSSSETSSMISVHSSTSSQGSQSSQGSSQTTTQFAYSSQNQSQIQYQTSSTSPPPPTLPPKTSRSLRSKSNASSVRGMTSTDCMPSCINTNSVNDRCYQETASSSGIAGRSHTISHPHKSVGDVFSSAWKKGSELQQQKEDRMSFASTGTMDSLMSDPRSQSSRSSSSSLGMSPYGRHTVTGIPLPGILKSSPQPPKPEQPKDETEDMDLQSHLLKLELDLETQKPYEHCPQPGRLPGFPTAPPVPMKHGSDEVDSNANQVQKATVVRVSAIDGEAVSVTVASASGLTKHESLKKNKPPPPPKRSAETSVSMSRSASVGNYRAGISPSRESQKRVQFKDEPEIDMPPPPIRTPTPPPTENAPLPPPPFPIGALPMKTTTPTTPNFPSPPSPIYQIPSSIASPQTPDFPAPPPLTPTGSHLEDHNTGEKVRSLSVNPGFLADLNKAVGGTHQQSPTSKKPPPPPKRSEQTYMNKGSISKGKKVPPPPPQRHT
ncbi:uncharacterized protein LOC144433984 isoform X3 [Glandiceps talaboti]